MSYIKVNYDKFMKQQKYVLNREKSLQLSKNMPSIRKKHVKAKRKVLNALDEIEKNKNWSWYDEVKRRYQPFMSRPMTFYRVY